MKRVLKNLTKELQGKRKNWFDIVKRLNVTAYDESALKNPHISKNEKGPNELVKTESNADRFLQNPGRYCDLIGT